MNSFGPWWDTTITIFNRFEDPQTQVVTWYRTVLYNNFWQATGNKVVIGNIVHHFKTLGYKVGINKPFSNSKTLNVPVEYHTVMIEVNKRLYMNEQTLEKSDSFYKLRDDIQSLYDVLLKR